jgi:hypothetical protein
VTDRGDQEALFSELLAQLEAETAAGQVDGEPYEWTLVSPTGGVDEEEAPTIH